MTPLPPLSPKYAHAPQSPRRAARRGYVRLRWQARRRLSAGGPMSTAMQGRRKRPRAGSMTLMERGGACEEPGGARGRRHRRQRAGPQRKTRPLRSKKRGKRTQRRADVDPGTFHRSRTSGIAALRRADAFRGEGSEDAHEVLESGLGGGVAPAAAGDAVRGVRRRDHRGPLVEPLRPAPPHVPRPDGHVVDAAEGQIDVVLCTE